MIFDLHIHVIGGPSQNSGNFISSRFKKDLTFQILARQFGVSNDDLKKDRFNEFSKRTLESLDESQLDAGVILAMDGAYHPDGQFDREHSLLRVDNDFVADIADGHPKALFGASIHPYRKDALGELERVSKRGACLVKWLPGAQNITPNDPRCFEFYEALANYKIPLLCHTGNEHTIKSFPNTLNDPRRLVPALKRGVTVIAAHCGSKLYLHESDYFKHWRTMALEHDRFFGDISAFGVITRMGALQSILKDQALTSKILFGSDFPSRPWTLSLVGQLGVSRTMALHHIKNPFDQMIKIMKALGVPEAVFSRAENILRIPTNKLKSATVGGKVIQ